MQELTATQLGRGIYLRRSGDIFCLGEFFTSQQIVFDKALIYLNETTAVGHTTATNTNALGYDPFGSTTPSFGGGWDKSVTIVSQGPLTTPLKSFPDTIEVEFVSVFTPSTGGSGTRTDTIWFARDVGPVQLELEDRRSTSRLVAATINGVPLQ